jgi:hypothetical protein
MEASKPRTIKLETGKLAAPARTIEPKVTEKKEERELATTPA